MDGEAQQLRKLQLEEFRRKKRKDEEQSKQLEAETYGPPFIVERPKDTPKAIHIIFEKDLDQEAPPPTREARQSMSSTRRPASLANTQRSKSLAPSDAATTIKSFNERTSAALSASSAKPSTVPKPKPQLQSQVIYAPSAKAEQHQYMNAESIAANLPTKGLIGAAMRNAMMQSNGRAVGGMVGVASEPPAMMGTPERPPIMVTPERSVMMQQQQRVMSSPARVLSSPARSLGSPLRVAGSDKRGGVFSSGTERLPMTPSRRAFAKTFIGSPAIRTPKQQAIVPSPVAPPNMSSLDDHVEKRMDVEKKLADEAQFLAAQIRDSPWVFYINQPLLLRVVDPVGDVIKEEMVSFPPLDLLSMKDAQGVAEAGNHDLARAIYRIVATVCSVPSVYYSQTGHVYIKDSTALKAGLWLRWAKMEEDFGDHAEALKVYEEAEAVGAEPVDLIKTEFKRFLSRLYEDVTGSNRESRLPTVSSTASSPLVAPTSSMLLDHETPTPTFNRTSNNRCVAPSPTDSDTTPPPSSRYLTSHMNDEDDDVAIILTPAQGKGRVTPHPGRRSNVVKEIVGMLGGLKLASMNDSLQESKSPRTPGGRRMSLVEFELGLRVANPVEQVDKDDGAAENGGSSEIDDNMVEDNMIDDRRDDDDDKVDNFMMESNIMEDVTANEDGDAEDEDDDAMADSPTPLQKLRPKSTGKGKVVDKPPHEIVIKESAIKIASPPAPPTGKKASAMRREKRQTVRFESPAQKGQQSASAPDTPGATVTVLTPVRSKRKDRESLGLPPHVITPVRRSIRNMEADEDSPIIDEDGENEDPNAEIKNLLEQHGFAFVPNKAIDLSIVKNERFPAHKAPKKEESSAASTPTTTLHSSRRKSTASGHY
ncbi:hypothetical protein SmJEL517_g02065 [Synchytrium microbalum]|uniref:Uncharacterized protein n=1 Tax=Synchytrium microbalum TaxID=1806994 RepID=A0A507CDA6_9FUNG|nr:uncharacterized protein SmJEL517_g02065 [Synchytrium microbalum]TPX35545.1 hypothetical protein SmJEL517_g02065 [Synchytrium microbalum]